MKNSLLSISQFEKHLDKMFPFSLASFEYNGLLGIEVDRERPVKKVAVTLGLSRGVVQQAIRRQYDTLLVHNAPESLDNGTYYQSVSSLARRNEVRIFRLHLPLDFAREGLIETLCSSLGFPGEPTVLKYQGFSITGGVYMYEGSETYDSIMHRIYRIKPSTIRVAGAVRRNFHKIAITTGDGCKPEFLDQLRPDAYICGLLNQESERIARDLHITIFEATSYATENEPLKVVFEKLRTIFPSSLGFHFIDLGDSVKGGE